MTNLSIPRPTQQPAPRHMSKAVVKTTDVFSSGYGPILDLKPFVWIDPATLVEGRYAGKDLITGWDQQIPWSSQAANLHIRGGGTAESIPWNNRQVIAFGDKGGNLGCHIIMPQAYTFLAAFSLATGEYSGSVHSLFLEAISLRTGVSTMFWEWNAPPTATTGALLFNPAISAGGGSSLMDGALLPAHDNPFIVAVSFDGVNTSKQYINDGTPRVTKTDHTLAPSNADQNMLYYGSRIYDDTRGVQGVGAGAIGFPLLTDAQVGAVMTAWRGPGFFNLS